jgi:hypothetical protein
MDGDDGPAHRNSTVFPHGRVVEQRQTHWVRVRNGKLIEHQAVRDGLRLLVQLGAVLIYEDLAEGRTIGIPSCALFEAVARGAQLEILCNQLAALVYESPGPASTSTISQVGVAIRTGNVPTVPPDSKGSP